ncbi:MAG: CobW family GTP-binding protein [Planctomycetota bacterium]|jgi:G3E family GTPase
MEAYTHSQSAVPLTILTGFLGAGKTTLLNRILNGEHGLRVAVLVNDFGAINIDADLVVGVEDNMISLANGCVCCSIRDDLVESVEQVLERPDAVEYIILEASGVADPMGIVATFIDPNLHDRIRIDSITCVVDAEQVLADSEYHDFVRLKLLQIGCADMVILNKVDLAGREEVKRVREWIDDQLNRVRVIEASHCDVPLEILLSVGRFDPAQLDFDQNAHDDHNCDVPGCTDEHHPSTLREARDTASPGATDHSKTFSTWSYESDRPFSLEALKEMVRKKLPETVYRCKGVIYAVDEPERRAVLQVVGRRADVTLLDEWNGRPPRTRIVAIGIPKSMDAQVLKEHFDTCLC